MRYSRLIFPLLMVFMLLALGAVGAEPFALDALHLIHWEQIPEGRPSDSGPVSAAVLMAWYAEHGYPELLPDLNEDGRVDEEDTRWLARELGDAMGSDVLNDRLADPFLVYPLARYIAQTYPDTFRMVIHDASFAEEVERDLGQSFHPEEIPGITIEVLEDPFYELYVHHLEQRRPGIVGIGHDVPEWNDFAVSRSYIPEDAPEGRPVDLVNSGFMQFGHEEVWNTFMRFEHERWSLLRPEWVPFEFFLILIPEGEDDGASHPGDDPGDDPGDTPGQPGDDPGDTPGQPGDDPGDTPRQPGDGPGDDPQNGGTPGTPPPVPGDTPGGSRDPFDERQTAWPCCLPDGSCEDLSVEECRAREGISNLSGLPCEELTCPSSSETCGAVEGEITDICYTYERGILSVYVSFAIHNRSSVTAQDITAYGLVGLNDGVNGLGGGPECQDWKYGLDIPGNSTYTYDHVFTTSAPNLDLNNLSYLYGALWLQTDGSRPCWPIIKQAWVNTWDPAPLCNPSSQSTPPGTSGDGGLPGGQPPELGVCCLPNGTCEMLGPYVCDARGGAFFPDAEDCSDIDCGKAVVGDCPKLVARISSACYSVAPDGNTTLHVTLEIENTGTADANDVTANIDAGFGYMSPNTVFLNSKYIEWETDVATGQTVTKSFEIPIGVYPTNQQPEAFPWIDHKLWMDENGCNWWTDQSIAEIDPDGSLPQCGGRESGSSTETKGACCLPSGGCLVVDSATCDSHQGEFYGEGTACGTVACSSDQEAPPATPQDPVGACCFPGGGCSIMDSTSCDAEGGEFYGEGTDCSSCGN